MRKIFPAALVFNLTILFVGCGASSDVKVSPETSPASVQVSAPGADAAEPAIAADADGNFYVVYVEHAANKSADVFLRKFDSKLNPVDEPVRVNPQSGTATAWRGDAPTVVVGANKTVFVGWTKHVKTEAASGTDLQLSVSRDAGKTFAAPVKVNDDIKPASHGMHSLAVGTDGKIYMAWLDERNLKTAPKAENFDLPEPEFQFVKAHHNSNQKPTPEVKKVETEAAEPNSEVFFAASNDGGKTFSANKKLSSEVCPCCKTNLLVAPDNRVYASWRQVLSGDFRHIAVASSTDAGKSFSAPAIVSDDRWQLNACPVSGAALAIDKNNQLKVAWFTAGTAGKPGLYQAESKDAGAPFSDRRLISETAVEGTPIFTTDDDGNFKVVWETDGKIYQSVATADSASAQIVGDGNLPAAVTTKGKTYTAFIKKENDKRAIWLAAF